MLKGKKTAGQGVGCGSQGVYRLSGQEFTSSIGITWIPTVNTITLNPFCYLQGLVVQVVGLKV